MAKLAIRTSNFQLSYKLIKELRARKIKFEILDPSEKLPSADDAQKYRIPHIWRGEAEEDIGQAMVNADGKGDSRVWKVWLLSIS